MPRIPRIDIPGFAQHIVQRGNDRQPCFFRAVDFARYLRDLAETAHRFDCAIHAYALMTNHVHLLATPRASGGVGRMMQALGRRYVGFINASRPRTGTLWEGRYKSSLVDSERYVLACYRYIELNPVRAGIVKDPGDYAWSSYRCNAFGFADSMVVPHAAYEAVARNAQERYARYRDLVAQGIPGEELVDIRRHAHRGGVLGSTGFREEVERRLQRPAALRPRGRPRKKSL